jgi:hypothetical protein
MTPRPTQRPALSARLVCITAAALLLSSSSGCKSPSIAAVVSNRSGAPITLIEVDYPSASFGHDALADGASFPYRFNIIGSGATKISWTDASRHNHISAGPELHEGQRGSLTIVITPGGAGWTAHLTP